MSDFEQEQQEQPPEERPLAEVETGWLPHRRLPLAQVIPVRALPWAAAVIALVALAGVLLALLWTALGPHVQILMTGQGPTLAEGNTEQFAGGDVRYAELTALAGLLAGVTVWQLRRWRGPLLVIALALGGLAGAYITARLGTDIGRETYQELLKTAPSGREFGQPMKLRAEGLMFLEAIIAVTVYMVLAAWSRFPDLGVPQVSTALSSSPSEPEAEQEESAPPGGATASSPPA